MIEYISHIQHVTQKGATEIIVPRPVTFRPGDLIVAAISSDYRVVGSPPPGWEEIKRLERRKDLIGVMCYKLAGTNEPASYRWPLVGPNTKAFASATVIVFRGAFPGSPVLSAAVNPARPNKTRADAPSVPGVKGGALICAWFHDDPQLPIAPATMIQLTQFSLWGDGHAVAYEILKRGGQTGIRTALLNPNVPGGGGNMSFSVAVRPHEFP